MGARVMDEPSISGKRKNARLRSAAERTMDVMKTDTRTRHGCEARHPDADWRPLREFVDAITRKLARRQSQTATVVERRSAAPLRHTGCQPPPLPQRQTKSRD